MIVIVMISDDTMWTSWSWYKYMKEGNFFDDYFSFSLALWSFFNFVVIICLLLLFWFFLFGCIILKAKVRSTKKKLRSKVERCLNNSIGRLWCDWRKWSLPSGYIYLWEYLSYTWHTDCIIMFLKSELEWVVVFGLTTYILLFDFTMIEIYACCFSN